MPEIEKTDEEWQAELSAEQFAVLRKGGTERAFTGKYVNTKDDGTYCCAGCGAELFAASTKYDSGSGWPSFWDAIDPELIDRLPDTSLGMVRTEIRCKRCGGHLGHVFDDGPQPTGERYCVNSLSLDLKPS